jgi:hypothetical protein
MRARPIVIAVTKIASLPIRRIATAPEAGRTRASIAVMFPALFRIAKLCAILIPFQS